MNLDEVLQTFIIESRELLQDMEDSLLIVEAQEDQTESIGAIFRAAHTIKGSAGLFGLDDIVDFTHVLESVLDEVRDGKVAINTNIVALFLSCSDHMKVLIDHLAEGGEGLSDDGRAVGNDLISKLSTYLDATNQPNVPQVIEAAVEASDAEDVDNDNWHISLRFNHVVLRNGMDPLSFFRYLGTIGEIVQIITHYDAIPEAAQMDPEDCYLYYDINFRSDADKVTIEDVFEFVRDDCLIHILPPNSRITDYVGMIQSLPEEDFLIGEMLVRCGSLTPLELEAVLKLQSRMELEESTNSSFNKPPLGKIMVDEGVVDPQVVAAAITKQKNTKSNNALEGSMIRVDANRLDQLINLVGELVIAGASAALLAEQEGSSSIKEAASNVTRLVEEIRDGTLQLRMVQIGETFNRFNRVVYDVSKELKKNIVLELSGTETELDKTVVERIGDPLMHLVRNSLDHGIESPEVRVASGKSAQGTLRLNSYHESGSIVIEISDDGAGLNRDKILAKAIEKDLISADHQLTDEEIHNLIFEAGFSTIDQVSNLSGRGVGMDVVRRNIEALRGSVKMESEQGVGTTTRIKLPLTLAIIDGFLMGVGSSSYVVPLDMVAECIELTEVERKSSQGRNFIDLRGEVLPFIRLREMFHVQGEQGRRENIVVVQSGTQKAGFVVDTLMGEFQTVIKPLGALFSNLKCISGSTILGSGEVALILDVPALIEQTLTSEQDLQYQA